MMITINISKSKSFNKVFLPHLNNDRQFRYENLYGGAGSGKSVFYAQKKVYQHLKDKGRNTLVVRNVSKTNRHSTFALIRRTISDWNLQSLFKINKSDMVITCENGNQIMFAGLDDPEKLKSITFERGDLTDIWIEEANEVSEDAFDQLDLRLRGKNKIPFQIGLTYNPVSALHWIKKRFHDAIVPNNINLKTTYLDNKFIDEEYKAKLEALKETSPILYNIYALGEWGVLGNLVYSNYEVREFEDDFDRHYNGLDWGYNDPAAGLRMGYRDQVIYIIDEFYVTEKDNPELMEVAEKIWNKSDMITADSAEPKSIKEWKKEGWRIRGAKKGRDSVRYGIGWIRSHKMVIHPRCQNFINEIQAYAYRQDRYGNTMEEPVDYKNHNMDCMRYGLEELMRERNIDFLR